MKQVVLVEITDNGSDVALFLDGQYIISADPGAGDDINQVISTAEGLSNHFMVELVRHEHSAKVEWQWNEVQDELIEKGVLLNRDFWVRDDIQFVRFTNSINSYENHEQFVKHVMADLDLKNVEVHEILEQSAKTMNEINQLILG